MSAKDDLIYLGQRLQGILGLLPFLEKIENLENWIQERETVLKGLSSQQDQLTSVVEELKNSVQQARDQILKDREKAEHEITKLYSEHSKRINKEREDEQKTKTLRLEDFANVIEQKTNEIKTLDLVIAAKKKEVAEQEQRYANITIKLKSLKEQI